MVKPSAKGLARTLMPNNKWSAINYRIHMHELLCLVYVIVAVVGSFSGAS